MTVTVDDWLEQTPTRTRLRRLPAQPSGQGAGEVTPQPAKAPARQPDPTARPAVPIAEYTERLALELGDGWRLIPADERHTTRHVERAGDGARIAVSGGWHDAEERLTVATELPRYPNNWINARSITVGRALGARHGARHIVDRLMPGYVAKLAAAQQEKARLTAEAAGRAGAVSELTRVLPPLCPGHSNRGADVVLRGAARNPATRHEISVCVELTGDVAGTAQRHYEGIDLTVRHLTTQQALVLAEAVRRLAAEAGAAWASEDGTPA